MLNFMYTESIQEQIDIIRRATEKALQSKEATLQFLISAGIIDQVKEKQRASKSRKIKK
jgi:hypothetical protein